MTSHTYKPLQALLPLFSVLLIYIHSTSMKTTQKPVFHAQIQNPSSKADFSYLLFRQNTNLFTKRKSITDRHHHHHHVKPDNKKRSDTVKHECKQIATSCKPTVSCVCPLYNHPSTNLSPYNLWIYDSELTNLHHRLSEYEIVITDRNNSKIFSY